jgi:signal transduction histidine kinase
MGTTWPNGTRAASERDAEQRHELRSALFGIEASAHGLSSRWTELTTVQINHLTTAMVDEVRRVRALLDGRAGEVLVFDLATAIAPALTAARASGQLVASAVPRGLQVHGCPDAARQVVVALLDNARRHAAGSPVELRTTRRDGVVTLFVEDRGPGIARRRCARVFERGVRGGGSGSGLGLFIARRLMTEHGGSIAARRRRGGGTTFVLCFRSADPR